MILLQRLASSNPEPLVEEPDNVYDDIDEHLNVINEYNLDKIKMYRSSPHGKIFFITVSVDLFNKYY